MANEKRMIDANALLEKLSRMIDYCKTDKKVNATTALFQVGDAIMDCPTVDAVELPKGKPGDYLEWDNGTGFRQIYCIYAVMICEDCMRYDLEEMTPTVNHKNIVRIMSREEAKAALAKMDGDGNA